MRCPSTALTDQAAASSVFLGFCLLFLTSCVHPNRISRGTLGQLTKRGESFVLVFGSLSTTKGTLALPTIRFSRQADRSSPEYPLKSLTITSGDRFYTILQRPKEASYTLPYLDEFYIAVGSANKGFDRINYVRLPQGEAPVAVYVGEIEMSPAASRTTQGQAIVVNVQDDFQNASRELKRLYPRFEGTIVRSVFSRKSVVPPPAPPPMPHALASDTRSGMPYREQAFQRPWSERVTFYVMRKIGVREPGGHLVVFGAMPMICCISVRVIIPMGDPVC